MLESVDVGVLAGWEVESGEDALSALEDVDAEGGLLRLRLRLGVFWYGGEGSMVEVGFWLVGVTVAGGNVLPDDARDVAGDAACAVGVLEDIVMLRGKEEHTIHHGLGGYDLHRFASSEMRWYQRG